MIHNKAIEVFYYFFQGILTFQVLFFGVLYFVTRRKDLLYYSMFLFFAAVYFFINAPFIFFGVPPQTMWKSPFYHHVNTPVIITENLFYILFLQSFFADITPDKNVKIVLSFTLRLVPFIVGLYVLLTILQMNRQVVFYTVKMISVIPAIAVAYVVIKRRPKFAVLMANGLLCTIFGTSITVLMIALGNNGVDGLFTQGYPLFFIRLGLLCDMIFYLAAILNKWHYQEKQLAIEKLQSQLEVEKLRIKISGELHDDVGSTLSGIAMYTYLINEQLLTGKYDEARHSVDTIQRSANEMTQNLGDLVWAINPEKDSLKKLVERLESYAGDMACSKHMAVKMHVSEKMKESSLSMESRRNIYLFCKEAINNAVKYSDGSLLKLEFSRKNGWMEFAVSDNGRGFDATVVKLGNGLHNMEERAKAIGAKFILEPGVNKGCRVAIRYKIP